jgi:Flp pilus assembly protein TadG
VKIVRRSLARWGAEARGQSLVEVALTLPLLLLLVIGIVDVGRIYTYKLAVTNAAREAAIQAARDPQATADVICQRARDELGAGAGNCNTVPILVTCDRAGAPCGNATAAAVLYQNGPVGDGGVTDGRGGADVSVTVSYQLSLISTYLVSRAFNVNPVTLSATAAFAGLGE